METDLLTISVILSSSGSISSRFGVAIISSVTPVPDDADKESRSAEIDRSNFLTPSRTASWSSLMLEIVTTSSYLSTYVSVRVSASDGKSSRILLVTSTHDNVSSTEVLRVMLSLVTLMDDMVI